MSREVTYTVKHRPTLNNAYHAQHYRKQATTRKEYGELFFYEAKINPHKFDYVDIEVFHYIAKGVVPDTGSVWAMSKAGIDFIVRAGVLPDDSPEYVRSIKFHAPEKREYFGMAIKLIEII